jgi:hypothetical protein
MRDLLVIVPSRGRPAEAAELYDLLAATSTAQTDMFLAYDEDDPAALRYRRLACSGWRTSRGGECRLWSVSGPRQGLAAWTNQIAAANVGQYRALASLGDDHRPRTPGWDEKLLAALDKTGGTGIAYGDDLLMGARLPTAAVVSSDIVAALGWMCQPSMRHYCVDNVWHVLGTSAGCLHYLPDVIIEHLHYLRTGNAPDPTYRAAESRAAADHDALHRWVRGDAAADIAVVKGLLQDAALADYRLSRI